MRWLSSVKEYFIPTVVRLLVKLALAAQFFVVTRLLGLEAAGWFFSLFSAIQLGSIFTRGGSPVVALEAPSVCELNNASHRVLLLRTLLIGYRRELYIGLPVGACLGVMFGLLSGESLGTSFACAVAAALWLPAVTAREILENIFIGSKSASVGLITTGVLPAVALISCALLLQPVINLPALTILVTATTCALVCFSVFIWVAGYGVAITNKTEVEGTEEAVSGLIERKSSELRWPLWINNGILPHAPQVVAAIAFSGELATGFAAARALSSIVLLPSSIIYPYFVSDSWKWSSGSNRDGRAVFRSSFIKSTSAAIVCSMPGLFLVFFAAEALVQFLLGEESSSAVLALYVLTSLVFVNVISGPGPYALICAGRLKDYLHATLVGLCISVLGYLSAPYISWLAFLLVTGAGVGLVNVMASVYCLRLYKCWPAA